MAGLRWAVPKQLQLGLMNRLQRLAAVAVLRQEEPSSSDLLGQQQLAALSDLELASLETSSLQATWPSLVLLILPALPSLVWDSWLLGWLQPELMMLLEESSSARRVPLVDHSQEHRLGLATSFH